MTAPDIDEAGETGALLGCTGPSSHGNSALGSLLEDAGLGSKVEGVGPDWRMGDGCGDGQREEGSEPGGESIGGSAGGSWGVAYGENGDVVNTCIVPLSC